MQNDSRPNRNRQRSSNRYARVNERENRLALRKPRKRRSDEDSWRSKRVLIQQMDIDQLREYMEEHEY